MPSFVKPIALCLLTGSLVLSGCEGNVVNNAMKTGAKTAVSTNILAAANQAIAPMPAPEPTLGQHPAYDISTFKSVGEAPFSTLSMDVDTASYTMVRRVLRDGQLPAPEMVRIEEMLNYFTYDYPSPDSIEDGFRPTASLFKAPWDDKRVLLRVGVKAYTPTVEERKPLNLVLLIDRSGSMSGPDRLALVQQAIPEFLDSLDAKDKVSIVAYADGTEVLAEPSNRHGRTAELIQALQPSGGTAGGSALKQAYREAEKAYDPKAENRILLITDGDFNIGISDPERLRDFVDARRRAGIGLSVLGVGAGNFNDRLIQAIVQSGDGIAAYADSYAEARRVFANRAAGLLQVVASDAKIQVEFNPRHVAQYRLIGYETRLLETQDFKDSSKDAGDIGAGRSVTAVYEIIPTGVFDALMPESRYAQTAVESAADLPQDQAAEWAQIKVAFKPHGSADAQRELRLQVKPAQDAVNEAMAPDDALSAAIVAFGGKLRRDPAYRTVSYEQIETLVQHARSFDPRGWRAELLHLVGVAKGVDRL